MNLTDDKKPQKLLDLRRRCAEKNVRRTDTFCRRKLCMLTANCCVSFCQSSWGTKAQLEGHVASHCVCVGLMALP